MSFSLPAEDVYVWGNAGNTKSQTAAWLTAFLQSLKTIYAAPQTLTISSGVIAPSCMNVVVDTESSASSDDLTHIATSGLIGSVASQPPGATIPSSSAETRILLIRIADQSRQVRLYHAAGGSGQIICYTGAHITLRHPSSLAVLLWDPPSSSWRVTSVIWGSGAVDHKVEFRGTGDTCTLHAQSTAPALVVRRDVTTTGEAGLIVARQKTTADAWADFAKAAIESTSTTPAGFSGRVVISTARNGALAQDLVIGGGIASGNATPQGIGTVNAAEYYVGGVRSHPRRTQIIESALPAVGSFVDIPHSLGVRPDLCDVFLICQSASAGGGYAVGDAVPANAALDYASGDARQIWPILSATTVRIARFRTTILPTKDATSTFTINDANWSLRVVISAIL